MLTVHDLCFMLSPRVFSPLRRHYYRYMIPRSIKLCDAIIADSDSTRNDILKHMDVGDSEVQTIHLGVDPVYFYQVEGRHARAA